MSEEAWILVKSAVQETITLINNAALKLPPEAGAGDLARAIITSYIAYTESYPTSRTQNADYLLSGYKRFGKTGVKLSLGGSRFDLNNSGISGSNNGNLVPDFYNLGTWPGPNGRAGPPAALVVRVPLPMPLLPGRWECYACWRAGRMARV